MFYQLELYLTSFIDNNFFFPEGGGNRGKMCTGIKLTSKEGKSVHGRTLEFGIPVDTSIVVIPRDYPFTATTPLGKGLSYKTKYAAVGAICFDQLQVMDGMNEKGLSVGVFYFPSFAGYTPTTPENQARSLSPTDFSNWILTQFSSLEEVKSNLAHVAIAPTIIKEWGNAAPPFHYIVYDKSGMSLVIEPIDGKLAVHDNPIGVFTNSPTFEWHMTNLRNFINLTPDNAAPLKVDDLVLTPFGQGSGLVGMPGDFTPPSRFVRAAIYTITALPVKSENEAVFQAFHILNQFDIPIGVARTVENGKIYSDYTQATTVRDPNNLKFYFRTYEDETIRMVDLNFFDKGSRHVVKTPTAGRQSYEDISAQLQP